MLGDFMAKWICALELDQDRQIIAGSEKALSNAVRRGADLRVGTAFRHNEHIDTCSTNTELVREVMDLRVVYLLKDYWGAGVQNLRPSSYTIRTGTKQLLGRILMAELPLGQLGCHRQMIIGTCPSTMN